MHSKIPEWWYVKWGSKWWCVKFKWWKVEDAKTTSKYTVRWSDGPISTCIGWMAKPKQQTQQHWMNRRPGCYERRSIWWIEEARQRIWLKSLKHRMNRWSRQQFVQCVVWTSLGPLPRWVPGPTTRWAPGTTRLALHGTWWREAQGLERRSTRLGSCTCPALYGRLLDVLD
jgi:hypothetical protein